MSYQEEEKARLRRRSSRQAIVLAMEGRWREAVAVNKSLIESFPDDVDACNRLGRAYMELGEYSQAREAYSRALEIAPYNTIAKKNLHRLSQLGEALVGLEGGAHKVEPQHFIEEIGKAGVVNLHQLARREVLAKMSAGDRVFLKVDCGNLIVENGRGEYLGQVERKHGRRLVKLIKGGNKYTAAIISSAEGMITIIIREVFQDSTQAGHLSFPPRRFLGVQPQASDRLFRRELEYEREEEGEPGYTIVGGEGAGVFLGESLDSDNEVENEE